MSFAAKDPTSNSAVVTSATDHQTSNGARS